MPMYVPASEQLAADAASGKPLSVAAGGTGATSPGQARGVLNETGRADPLMDLSAAMMTKKGAAAFNSISGYVQNNSWIAGSGNPVFSRCGIGIPNNLFMGAASRFLVTLSGGSFVIGGTVNHLFDEVIGRDGGYSIPAGQTGQIEIDIGNAYLYGGGFHVVSFYASVAQTVLVEHFSAGAWVPATVQTGTNATQDNPQRHNAPIHNNTTRYRLTVTAPTGSQAIIRSWEFYPHRNSDGRTHSVLSRLGGVHFAPISHSNAVATEKKNATQTLGVNRWRYGQSTTDNFEIDRHNSSGTKLDSPIVIDQATGLVSFSAGAKLTAAGDALGDYRDKPTFTPSLAGETTAGAPTYAVRFGGYTKVGSRVEVDVDISISALGGMAGPVRITGLPFTSSNLSRRACPLFKQHINNPIGSLAEGLWAVIPANSTFAELHFQRETGDSSRVTAMDFNLSGPARITGTLTYFV